MKRWTLGPAAVLAALLIALPYAAPGQEVALTFDDLPRHGALPPGSTHVEAVASIARTLKERKAPPTYGIINAGKLEAEPAGLAAMKQWRAAGFPLGNHTYTHRNLHSSTVEEFIEDIARNEPTLTSLMGGENWHWFRYPFLREGDTLDKRRPVIAHLKDSGYRVAQVTLDFEDYAWNAPYARCVKQNDVEAIAWLKRSYLETASEYIRLGQETARLLYGRDIKHVMLLHVGAFNAVMLPDLLDLLNQRGFRLVSLEVAESDPAYLSDPNFPMDAGVSLLEQLMDSKGIELPPHEPKPFERLDSICR